MSLHTNGKEEKKKDFTRPCHTCGLPLRPIDAHLSASVCIEALKKAFKNAVLMIRGMKNELDTLSTNYDGAQGVIWSVASRTEEKSLLVTRAELETLPPRAALKTESKPDGLHISAFVMAEEPVGAKPS